MFDWWEQLKQYLAGDSSSPATTNPYAGATNTLQAGAIPGAPQYANPGYGKALAEQSFNLNKTLNNNNNNNTNYTGFLNNAATIVGMGSSLFNVWNALQQKKMMQQALDQAKRQYMFNVNAYNQSGALSTKMYNQALTDNYLGRYSYAGKSESDARSQADKDKLSWSNVAG